MHNCPTCGQGMPHIADLVVRQDLGQVSYRGETRHLNPQAAALLGQLAAKAESGVTKEQLLLAMYGDADAPGDPDGCLKVRMTWLRHKLEGWPFIIDPIPKRGYVLRRTKRQPTECAA